MNKHSARSGRRRERDPWEREVINRPESSSARIGSSSSPSASCWDSPGYPQGKTTMYATLVIVKVLGGNTLVTVTETV